MCIKGHTVFPTFIWPVRGPVAYVSDCHQSVTKCCHQAEESSVYSLARQGGCLVVRANTSARLSYREKTHRNDFSIKENICGNIPREHLLPHPESIAPSACGGMDWGGGGGSGSYVSLAARSRNAHCLRQTLADTT